MRKSEEEKFDKYVREGKRFIGYYCGYVTILHGETVIDAIKDFYDHYNAELTWVCDTKTENIYYGKDNDKPDVRGNYNRSFYHSVTNEFLFNVDELTKPIVELKPTKLDGTLEHAYVDRNGNIYRCGFECHHYLAKELFLSKTIDLPEHFKDNMNKDEVLDQMGWLKISSKRINFRTEKLSHDQKEFIKKYMDVMDQPTYEFRWGRRTKDEILNELNDY